MPAIAPVNFKIFPIDCVYYAVIHQFGHSNHAGIGEVHILILLLGPQSVYLYKVGAQFERDFQIADR